MPRKRPANRKSTKPTAQKTVVGKVLGKGAKRQSVKKAPAKAVKKVRRGTAKKKPKLVMPAAKKVAKKVWTPDQALPDGQHELFAQKMATCCYSNTSCYMQAYGDDLKGDTARTNASRLLANANVAARVEHLKQAGAKNAEAEVGEVIRLCLNIMRTPVGYVDEESPLAQEVQRDITGTEDEGVVTKVKVKIPGKLEAAKLLTQIKGWMKPQEVDLNVNYTRPDEALKRAMGAGVDVKAILGKLLGQEVKGSRGQGGAQ